MLVQNRQCLLFLKQLKNMGLRCRGNLRKRSFVGQNGDVHVHVRVSGDKGESKRTHGHYSSHGCESKRTWVSL